MSPKPRYRHVILYIYIYMCVCVCVCACACVGVCMYIYKYIHPQPLGSQGRPATPVRHIMTPVFGLVVVNGLGACRMPNEIAAPTNPNPEPKNGLLLRNLN